MNAHPLNPVASNAATEGPVDRPLDGIIVRQTIKTDVSYRVANKYILEEAPRFRLIHFGSETFYIPFPWMYYVVQDYRINDIWVTPVQAVEGVCPVSILPLPNMYEGRPCYAPRGSASAPVQDQIVAGINSYWEAKFNHDGTPLESHPVWNKLANEIEAAGGSRANVLQHWELLSIEEALALPWPQNKKLDVGPPIASA